MKIPRIKTLQNVPIPDLAHICRVLCLILLAVAALFSEKALAANDPAQMSRLYQQYMNEPSKQLYQRGNDFLQKGQLDEAMVCFTIVGNRYDVGMTKDEKRICAYALNNAGGIAQLRFSFSSAFGYFQKAMEVSDEPIYQSYNNIAGIYLFFNDYGTAKRYLNQAFDISMKQKDWGSLTNSLQNIMYLNWCLDSVAESKNCIDRYMQLKTIPHDSLYLGAVMLSKGMTALMKGRNAEAIDYFRQYIENKDAKMAVKNVDANSAHLYIASTYMRMRDYDHALRFLKQAEQEAQREEITDLLLKVYQCQEKCYRLMGDRQQEHQAKYKLMSLKDSINTADEFGKIKNIEFFHEVDKYEKQVVKLNEEKNARSVIAIVCGIGLLAVACLLIFAVRQNRKLSESNKDLYRKNDELVRQADMEKELRASFSKRVKAYEEEITSLKQTAAQTTNLPATKLPNSQSTQQPSDQTPKRTTSPATNTRLGDDQRASLLEKIYQQMDDVSFICQQDLTIERLAHAVGSNEKYVSQAINESMNKNFNTLLNEYRIREICKRLTDFQHYGNMTNETIAEGVGFKSRSHFIRTFKMVTGLTPSQYQKIAKSEGSGTDQ